MIYICRLKAYIVLTFWAEKSIFPESVQQNTADPGQIQYTWTCQGVTTFSEFWARSAHFGQNGGWVESRGARVFCVVIQTTFRQFRNRRFPPNLATKQLCPIEQSEKTFPKIFTVGVICPQNLKSKVGQTGTSLRAGYRSQEWWTAERYCLLHAVIVQGQGVSKVWSTYLYEVRLWSYGASKLPIFRILAYFPPIQNP